MTRSRKRQKREHSMNDSEMIDVQTSATDGVVDVDNLSADHLGDKREHSKEVHEKHKSMEEHGSKLSTETNDLNAQEIVQQEPGPSTSNKSIEDYMCMDVTERIQHCIEYSRDCIHKGESPALTSNFYVLVTDPPSEICQTIRSAAKEGVAQLVWSAPSEECYTLGVCPPPVPSGYPYAVTAGPQWWVGLNDAQIRAGPDADAGQVSRAQSYLKSKAKRRAASSKKSNSQVNITLRKLDEGLMRQENDLPMCASDDENMEEE